MSTDSGTYSNKTYKEEVTNARVFQISFRQSSSTFLKSSTIFFDNPAIVFRIALTIFVNCLIFEKVSYEIVISAIYI